MSHNYGRPKSEQGNKADAMAPHGTGHASGPDEADTAEEHGNHTELLADSTENPGI